MSAPRPHFESLIQRLIAMGSTPIALYGAGRIARSLRPTLGIPPGAIACIIDDDPAKRGTTWGGLPVCQPDDDKPAHDIRSVIITAEGAAQDALWSRRAWCRERGLYLLTCPPRFPSKEWDDALIDQYELTIARSRGLNPAYIHSYPAPDAKADRRLVELLRHNLPTTAAPTATICEIGPGAGLMTEHLIPHAATCHAVDYSPRLLFEVLEHRFAPRSSPGTRNPEPGIRLQLHHDESATLRAIPDGSIDLLFSFDVFVHFKIDVVHQFMEAFARVLRPGRGVAIVHFARWNDAEVESWRTSQRPRDPARAGTATNIQYNEPDWVAASARAVGLGFEVVDGEWGGRNWYGRIAAR